jgi:hypothetical protein
MLLWVYIHTGQLAWKICLARDAGTGGAGGAAAPVALYQEGQGGKGALSI